MSYGSGFTGGGTGGASMTGGFSDFSMDSFGGGDFASGYTGGSSDYSSGWTGGGSTGAPAATTSGHDYAGSFAPGQGSPGTEFLSGGDGLDTMQNLIPGSETEPEEAAGTTDAVEESPVIV